MDYLQTINAIDFVLFGTIFLLWAYCRSVNNDLKTQRDEYLTMAIDVQKRYNDEFAQKTEKGLNQLVERLTPESEGSQQSLKDTFTYCPDCDGDGFFEIVVPQDNYITGTQEIFEKEECPKCNGKGVTKNG